MHRMLAIQLTAICSTQNHQTPVPPRVEPRSPHRVTPDRERMTCERSSGGEISSRVADTAITAILM